jgi:hypothetical protein
MRHATGIPEKRRTATRMSRFNGRTSSWVSIREAFTRQ